MIRKYRTGVNLMFHLFPLAVSPSAVGANTDYLTAPLKARYMRHLPTSSDRRPTCLFEIEFPQQLGLAYKLLEKVIWLREIMSSTTACHSASSLRDKLANDLGLYHPMVNTSMCTWAHPMERAMVAAIAADPADMLNWTAYADWMEENDIGGLRSAAIRTNLRGRKVAA